MPRISDDFMDCVIYLYPSVSAAEAGDRIGGSGFLFGVPSKRFPGYNFIYAVTNRHVVEGGACCVRLNTVSGEKDVLEFDDRHWVVHPAGDDIAVCGLPALHNSFYKYKFLSEPHLLTKEIIDNYNIGPGDDVIVVGRFISHEGKQRNLPTMRFGNISQMPWEPLAQERAGGFFPQESFLCEARSIGGYSGAPVLVGLNSTFSRPDRPGVVVTPGQGMWLLGIDWGHICDQQPIFDAGGRATGQTVRTNTGMMAVVPVWKLHEILYSDGALNAREKTDEQIAQSINQSPVAMDGLNIPKSD